MINGGLHGNCKNEVGNKYGRWTVISLAEGHVLGQVSWVCRCECGEEKTVRGVSLRRGGSKSCGCLQKEQVSARRLLPDDESAINSFISNLKYSAKSRGLVFNLSRELILSLSSSSCYYCGRKPSQIHKVNKGKSTYTYNGIDRMDNNVGYEIDNVVSCCFTCNKAKGTRNVNEFLRWIDRVYCKTFLRSVVR